MNSVIQPFVKAARFEAKRKRMSARSIQRTGIGSGSFFLLGGFAGGADAAAAAVVGLLAG